LNSILVATESTSDCQVPTEVTTVRKILIQPSTSNVVLSIRGIKPHIEPQPAIEEQNDAQAAAAPSGWFNTSKARRSAGSKNLMVYKSIS
jgi:hypothetical protein